MIPIVYLERLLDQWKARAVDLRVKGKRENWRKTGVPDYFCQPSLYAAIVLEEAINDLEREIQRERERILTPEWE